MEIIIHGNNNTEIMTKEKKQKGRRKQKISRTAQSEHFTKPRTKIFQKKPLKKPFHQFFSVEFRSKYALSNTSKATLANIN